MIFWTKKRILPYAFKNKIRIVNNKKRKYYIIEIYNFTSGLKTFRNICCAVFDSELFLNVEKILSNTSRQNKVINIGKEESSRITKRDPTKTRKS